MIAIISRSIEHIYILGVGGDETQARRNAFAYTSGNNSDGIYTDGEAIEVSAHFRALFDADSDSDAWEGVLSKHQALLNAYSHALVVDGKLDYVVNEYTTPRMYHSAKDLARADGVAAVPTMGGILADLPLSARDARRFPKAVLVPVTKAAVTAGTWIVVQTDEGHLAVSNEEARTHGFTEAANWLPDLTGISCVPAVGEIETHLAKQADKA